jgi:hypothetical protein
MPASVGTVAYAQEHCFACFRLIRPGQTYHMTLDFEVLRLDCALPQDVIRVEKGLIFGPDVGIPVRYVSDPGL